MFITASRCLKWEFASLGRSCDSGESLGDRTRLKRVDGSNYFPTTGKLGSDATMSTRTRITNGRGKWDRSGDKTKTRHKSRFRSVAAHSHTSGPVPEHPKI